VSVRVGVVVFPGSNCDTDTAWALSRAGAEPVELWHEHADLGGVAAVVLRAASHTATISGPVSSPASAR